MLRAFLLTVICVAPPTRCVFCQERDLPGNDQSSGIDFLTQKYVFGDPLIRDRLRTIESEALDTVNDSWVFHPFVRPTADSFYLRSYWTLPSGTFDSIGFRPKDPEALGKEYHHFTINAINGRTSLRVINEFYFMAYHRPREGEWSVNICYGFPRVVRAFWGQAFDVRFWRHCRENPDPPQAFTVGEDLTYLEVSKTFGRTKYSVRYEVDSQDQYRTAIDDNDVREWFSSHKQFRMKASQRLDSIQNKVEKQLPLRKGVRGRLVPSLSTGYTSHESARLPIAFAANRPAPLPSFRKLRDEEMEEMLEIALQEIKRRRQFFDTSSREMYHAMCKTFRLDRCMAR